MLEVRYSLTRINNSRAPDAVTLSDLARLMRVPAIHNRLNLFSLHPLRHTRFTMYLIRSDDADALRKLANSLDAIRDFTYCDLGELNTLELTELCDDASAWITGQPIVDDESNGLAIFAFAPSGVAWLAQNSDALAEFDADLDSLGAFAVAPGTVYALDTY